ncbi:MAG: N-acetylmuramoyl-L-alanine amidase [Geminicoccaceae bacterium]|nr:N-acetylmuramoyl-L-alanine amidase [Geminicoccaceae bacterium]
MEGGAAALRRLCDPDAKVSAHYLIDEAGGIARLVPEDCRAWHAGVSGWGGVDGLNDGSIGVELVNPGHDWGLKDFAAAQIGSLLDLLAGLRERHGIGPEGVLGHGDVAPGRKDDPGERFPWRRLGEAGFGLWTDAGAPADPDPLLAGDLLRRIGYRIDLPGTAPFHLVRAFQRRFRPARADGRLDAPTMGRIAAVARLPWHPLRG